MKKIILVLTVLMFYWSCDVPGNMVDERLDQNKDLLNTTGSTGIPPGTLPTPNPGDDPPPELPVLPPGSTTYPSNPKPSVAFPKPIPTNLPSVRVYLYNNSGYKYPLTVEGTTNMISGFRYLSSSVSASSIWGLSNLCDYRFNDQTSSIYVYNDTDSIIKLYFYEHLNYGGAKDSMTVQPGGYESIHNLSNETMNSHTSWNDDITSLTIEVERPFTITYCNDPHACSYNSYLERCYKRTCFQPSCADPYCNLDYHCHDYFCCHNSFNHCHDDCYNHPCPGHKMYH